jgi:hypothetical protein
MQTSIARLSRVLFSMCVLYALVAFMSLCTTRNTASATTTQTMCSSNSVPTGYVVVQVSNSEACSPYEQYTIETPSTTGTTTVCNVGNFSPSGWVITNIQTQDGGACDDHQPETLAPLTGSQMTACESSTIPSTWIVSAIQAAGSTCAQNEIYTIQLLQGTKMSACSITIPAGWVVISAGEQGTTCDSYSPTVIQVVSSLSSSASICDAGTFPGGYIISMVLGSGNNTCQNFDQFTITQESPTGTMMSGCYISAQSIGSNWIVSNVGSPGGSNCGTFPTEQITHVSPYAGSYTMCEGVSNLPPYWVVQGTSPTSQCVGYTTVTIAPLGGASVAPTDQVLVASHNPNTGAGNIPSDLNSDGLSDVILYNQSASEFEYFLTGDNGGNYFTAASRVISVTAGYWIGAIGQTGLVWTSANNDLYLWAPVASGDTVSFNSTFIADYPAGWTLIGAAASGSGSDSDLLWVDDATCQWGWWQMSGAQRTGLEPYTWPSCNSHIVAVGYYAGEASADLFVVTGGNYPDLQWWVKDASYGAIQPDGYAHLDLGPLPPGQFAGAASVLGSPYPVVYFTESNGTAVRSYTVNRSGSIGSLTPGSVNSISSGSYIGQIGGTYDGSGRQSLLWANDSAGKLSIWEQNGSAFVIQSNVVSYGGGWTVVGGLNGTK